MMAKILRDKTLGHIAGDVILCHPKQTFGLC